MPENPEPTAVRVPKYYLVKKEILALIAGLAPGTPVPTERELAARFAPSRTTVRQAIAELVVDGRLARTQGSGTFVLSRSDGGASTDVVLAGSQSKMASGSIVLDISEVPASAEAADDPGLGTLVHRVERLRTAVDEPTPGSLCCPPLPDLAGQLTAHSSLYRTLHEAYDITIATAGHDRNRAGRSGDRRSAGCRDGLPLLLINRTGWIRTGTPRMVRRTIPGDRFRFVSRQRLD